MKKLNILIFLKNITRWQKVSQENRLAYDCPWIVFCKMIKNVDNIFRMLDANKDGLISTENELKFSKSNNDK